MKMDETKVQKLSDEELDNVSGGSFHMDPWGSCDEFQWADGVDKTCWNCKFYDKWRQQCID